MAVSATLGMLGNFSKYDVFWLVFSLGGIFVMIGHSIWDKKVQHSIGKITWMIVTSFIFCLLVKFLYDEKIISAFSMVVSTLVVSMIAPAVTSIALSELPSKIGDQLLSLPEFFFDILKSYFEKWKK